MMIDSKGAAPGLPVHTCHAVGCPVAVSPKMLMCARHWRMVPQDVQRAIWRTYRPGQEQDKSASEAYLYQQRRAVMHVALQEGRVDLPQAVAEHFRADPRIWALADRVLAENPDAGDAEILATMSTMAAALVEVDVDLREHVDVIRVDLARSARRSP